MFLASDGAGAREWKARSFLKREPSLSLLIAAVDFEWTVSRAVLFLSRRPNRELRVLMKDFHSPKKYKELWKQEVASARRCKELPQIVIGWAALLKGFETRNLLVHGRDRVTMRMAEPHVEAILAAATRVDQYWAELGYPLNGRIPIRRMVGASVGT